LFDILFEVEYQYQQKFPNTVAGHEYITLCCFSVTNVMSELKGKRARARGLGQGRILRTGSV
jgi:hypothetical protein